MSRLCDSPERKQ